MTSSTTTNKAMTNSTVPPPMVWPTLQAHDAHSLIDFYVNIFGFLRTAVHGDGDQVEHSQLDWPEGGGIMLGSYRSGHLWSREPGTFGAYVVTDRIDDVYARVQGSAATIIREIADTDYGSREFTVQDPEGNLWSFGTYRGEPR
jgi:uncharacterized glyoxalase superfamily protein PhnB